MSLVGSEYLTSQLYQPVVITSTAPVWAASSGAWIASVSAQLGRLGRLQANWDSYGAAPISRRAIDQMIEVLIGIMNARAPAPTMVPSPQGHLQAEWHRAGIDLEVEVIDSTHIAVDYEGPDGPWSDVLSSDLRRLVRAINQLSAA